MVNSPAIQQANQMANRMANMMAEVNEHFQYISNQFYRMTAYISKYMDESLKQITVEQRNQIAHMAAYAAESVSQMYSQEHWIAYCQQLEKILPNYNLIHCHFDDISDEEAAENEKVNNKIVTEIFKPEEVSEKKDSGIITISPINDKVLKYLSENPESFYQLTDTDFEIVMAEIYSKLGYDVTRTKKTRDGGKDLIIRKPEVLGDFIYYVECKKYAAKRPIGVGIIRNLVGTVNTDRVNGGILATTSFFTRDAYEFISDNKWNCQIKTHDYNVIKDLLNKVV